ncbi:MAG: DNA alkylation repair protein [Acidimicrobiales bacterium]
MADLLKDNFGPEMIERAAQTIGAVYGKFDGAGFSTMALDGFEELELTPRCRQIADSMAEFLPSDRQRAIGILIDSLGPELENCDPAEASAIGDPWFDDNPMAGFFYMPHGYFLADHGEGHFDTVMLANYEITKRATSEFSIRTPLRDHTDATLGVLEGWASDENVHVRRLVSEGTRPRLPWAFRLTVFQENPEPVITLLDKLKDDPVEYVRRSVANNLNDITKDNPDVAIEVADRWWADGGKNRRRLVRHGLRTLIKAGHPGALEVLGYQSPSPARVAESSIEPSKPSIGDKVHIEVTLANPGPHTCRALVDLKVHFVKSNGNTSPKVFKGAELEIAAGKSATVAKTVSLAQHTTRRHFPGDHVVEVMINGQSMPLGSFELAADPNPGS